MFGSDLKHFWEIESSWNAKSDFEEKKRKMPSSGLAFVFVYTTELEGLKTLRIIAYLSFSFSLSLSPFLLVHLRTVRADTFRDYFFFLQRPISKIEHLHLMTDHRRSNSDENASLIISISFRLPIVTLEGSVLTPVPSMRLDVFFRKEANWRNYFQMNEALCNGETANERRHPKKLLTIQPINPSAKVESSVDRIFMNFIIIMFSILR